MLHHEESPEKPEYNMENPPFCLTPCFLAKNFIPPTTPISINFGKIKRTPTPLLWRDGGIRTMLNQNLTQEKLILNPVWNTFQLKVVSCRNQSTYLLGLPWIGFYFLRKGICKYNLLLLNSCKFTMHCSWTSQLPKPYKSIEKCLKTNKK